MSREKKLKSEVGVSMTEYAICVAALLVVALFASEAMRFAAGTRATQSIGVVSPDLTSSVTGAALPCNAGGEGLGFGGSIECL